ncbi:hypothetical protein LLO_2776 [Legionella longbeachae NSW150]|uniref:Uncharacterized protein n=2 Tax=Legionella longbeachae TaxID=450 RepID=D3HL90_LEGLN|nr:hypothetical protein LLO_2776 [Legionella longbeachae NSW150]
MTIETEQELHLARTACVIQRWWKQLHLKRTALDSFQYVHENLERFIVSIQECWNYRRGMVINKKR